MGLNLGSTNKILKQVKIYFHKLIIFRIRYVFKIQKKKLEKYIYYRYRMYIVFICSKL